MNVLVRSPASMLYICKSIALWCCFKLTRHLMFVLHIYVCVRMCEWQNDLFKNVCESMAMVNWHGIKKTFNTTIHKTQIRMNFQHIIENMNELAENNLLRLYMRVRWLKAVEISSIQYNIAYCEQKKNIVVLRFFFFLFCCCYCCRGFLKSEVNN